jgi:hypothetical protein
MPIANSPEATALCANKPKTAVTTARAMILRISANLPLKILLTLLPLPYHSILQILKVVAWAGLDPAHAIELLGYESFNF